MTDSYLHKGLRKKLVNTLIAKGIDCMQVLSAIERVPRHFFLESALSKLAYEDQALPIGDGQTISQPYTVAFQTQLLHLKRGEKVLEIGTGSGYQTAVLLELGAKVFTIERKRGLFLKSQSFLTQLGYRTNFFYGDGYLGLPTYAPFDKILITAGAPTIPEALKSQLAVGGILVAPIGNTKSQTMISLIKLSENRFETIPFGNFAFVPMLAGKD